MQKLLEENYDIPFQVTVKDCEYIIFPANEMEELFEVKMSLRSGVRLITEIYPQSHSSAMLRDISMASQDKRNLFFAYLEEFKKMGANVDIKINKFPNDLKEWPSYLKHFSIRINKILEQDSSFEKTAKEWGVFAVGMMLSLLNVVPLQENTYIEGTKYQIQTNRYERNPLNRKLCLQAYGYKCRICGFSFEETYGNIGKNFIHVHHIEPVSSKGGSYILDPLKDLIPVCPNCHAMLHTQTPPLNPSELAEILRKENGKE